MDCAKASVLVVDDDPDTAEITCMLIESFGHECAIAHSGRRALELARALRPQLALVDLSLPDMSGYEVARALRGTATYCVAATGFSGPEYRARAFAAGFADYLVKPYEVGAIESVIARGLPRPAKRTIATRLAAVLDHG